MFICLWRMFLLKYMFRVIVLRVGIKCEFWAFYVYLEIQTVLHFRYVYMFVRDVFVEMYDIYVIVLCMNNSWGFGLFIVCVWIIVEFGGFFFVYLEIQTVLHFGMFICCEGRFCCNVWNICYCIMCVNNSWILGFLCISGNTDCLHFWYVCEGGFCSNVWNICYCIMCLNNSWIWDFSCVSGNTDCLHFGYVYLFVKNYFFVEMYDIYVIVLCVWIIVEVLGFLCVSENIDCVTFGYVCLWGMFCWNIWNIFFMLVYYVSELT